MNRVTQKLRVTVHSRWTFPSLAEHGLDIQPNTATNVAIERVSLVLSQECVQFKQKQVMIKREAAPYGNCMNEWAETGMDEEAVIDGRDLRIPYTQGVKELHKLTFNYITSQLMITSHTSFARETVSLENSRRRPNAPTQGFYSNVTQFYTRRTQGF